MIELLKQSRIIRAAVVMVICIVFGVIVQEVYGSYDIGVAAGLAVSIYEFGIIPKQ